ncbi:MAG: thioredoxin domain-containing protein [Desulfococcaceae bacterium]
MRFDRWQFFAISSLILSTLLLAGPFFPTEAAARMDVTLQETLLLESPPKDVAVSADGEWIFVLAGGGTIIVFDSRGKQNDVLSVEGNIDGIEAGPRPDMLFLRSEKEKSVRLLQVEPIRDIDTAGSPFKGPADAPVEIVVFSEFECPYCAQLSPLLDDMAAAFPETVRVVYKHFPLRRREMSRQPAMAAYAAQQQGKFWEYHHRLYENFNELTPEFLVETARTLELDMEKFEADRTSPQAMAAVQKDIADAREAGVRAVPAVFVNGRSLRSRSIEAFQELVEKALAEARQN